MKNLIANYLMIFLVASMAAADAMDKPTKSKGFLSKIRSSFKLNSEEATQKLRALIDKKREDISLAKVQPLVASGANVEVQNAQGKTILIRAVEEDNSPLVLFLLQNGTNSKEGSLVPLAASHRNLKVLQALIYAGADINAKDKAGFSALYYAVTDIQPEIVSMLLSSGANPNVQVLTGDTLLHTIIKKDQYRSLYSPEKRDEIITLLLQKGADSTIADSEGKTPAQLLKGTKYEPLLKLPRDVKYDETSLKLLEQMQKGKGRK